MGTTAAFPASVSGLVRLTAAGRLDLAPSLTDHIPLADAVNRPENKIVDPDSSPDT
ncbi:hypothetical protein ABT124_38120 [Streptomyces sp. NPDC001982]|uniref:hypothetical protein n=1 Tax=unclassified Streptomyces TaxID=2593676 RepID=UPI0033272B75